MPSALICYQTLSFPKFEELNEAQKTKFNFPFIVCDKRLTRDAIQGTFRTMFNRACRGRLLC
jgi:2-oxo-4-hydroxy-4-carboxy--5-ureidoimidazoline (OHCU) decarboxylase